MNEPKLPRTTSEQVILALRRLNSSSAATNRVVGSVSGIKGSDLAVLDTLHQQGPQTPTELARRTTTHLATMTGILTRLERDGWIERRRDATDRRSVRIHSTGVDRLTEVYARSNASLAALIDSHPADQAEVINRFLIDAGEGAATLAEELSHGLEPGTPQTGRNPG